MAPPGTLLKISPTGTSSEFLLSNTTFTSFNFFPLFHKILNANLVDPLIRFRLVTIVVKVPPACFGVSTVYMMEPVSESRTVALRMSSSSPRAKDRFIIRRKPWNCRCVRTGGRCWRTLPSQRRIEPVFMAVKKCPMPKSISHQQRMRRELERRGPKQALTNAGSRSLIALRRGAKKNKSKQKDCRRQTIARVHPSCQSITPAVRRFRSNPLRSHP